ncbi:MAG: HAMP domain-containing histidine kinase [Clostridium sp.]|nr:HAMP domain-containing histidine kinase [Clostridium sp.]
MTKLRYWIAFYLAVMFGFYLLIGYGFQRTDAGGRDMVLYHEQCRLAEQALRQGEDRARVEQEYGCQILLFSDADYEIALGRAYQDEALIMDLRLETSVFAGKIVFPVSESRYLNMERTLYRRVMGMWGILLIGGLVLLVFFYLRFVRPFARLNLFARQVAKGNLDFPLPMKKHQYFGAFTESFDLMREELKRAKDSEYQANQSKKELVAELSHDIKTPIATIRATCEVLQIKEQNPDTRAKVAVIDAKAGMVDKLVSNLFQASLEELEVLKVEPTEEQSLCIREMFEELKDYSDIRLNGEVPSCLVWMDKLRLRQVIDNVVSNAWKYAGTPVTVSFWETEKNIGVRIRDAGEGVDAEELVLLGGKFYRGSNAKGKSGSGLGLYLARLFMERMDGGIAFYVENGFVVELLLKKV